MSGITLKDWQDKASATIVERFVQFQEESPSYSVAGQEYRFPFYQALGSLPASGKTAMLADAVNALSPHLAPQPVVLWLSKARVVVEQSLANLLPGGKYGHLLGDCAVKPLADYDPQSVREADTKLLYFATVGSFNQEDRQNSKLRVFSSSVDHLGASEDNTIWEALKRRTTVVAGDEVRRPLVVVYDEGHNLTDAQMALLLELEPAALIVASATMVLPASLSDLLNTLTTVSKEWKDKLVTNVDAAKVADSGLIKGNIDLAGYKTTMEDAVAALLERKQEAEAAAGRCAPWLVPKAIYVCQTNVVASGTGTAKEDPKRPFAQREAPPIVIWRYLVEERGVAPAKIAVYCNLEVDKQFPLPESFVLYRGGEKDYERFAASSYEHVIFNQSLQEGWDDPECYFAYIDKSMGSNTQVEQIVGRLLRQPRAQLLPEPVLNSAHFYVRVDNSGTFDNVVANVSQRLKTDNMSVRITTIKPGATQPTVLEAKSQKEVPQVLRDASRAREEIAKVMKNLVDHRGGGASTVSKGQRALAQVRVGDKAGRAEWAWEPYRGGSRVTARWVFESTIKKSFPDALQSVNSSDERLDARIQFDSPAYRDIQDTAGKVVQAYVDNIELKQRKRTPYAVGQIRVDEATAVSYTNALHARYGTLNPGERRFAEAVDKRGLEWCRNPEKSEAGYHIPLLQPDNGSYNFYPDFLIWDDKSDTAFAVDPKNDNILQGALRWKLMEIKTAGMAAQVLIRLVVEGKYEANVTRQSKDGWTVWSLRNGRPHPYWCETMDDAVAECVRA